MIALGLIIAVIALGSVTPGCNKGNAPKTPFVYDEEKDEPFNRSNYSEQTRDNYTLRAWTDGSLFTPSLWVDFYLEVHCPKEKTTSAIRVDIAAPGVSRSRSDFHNLFTKSDFETQKDGSLRIKIADCFRTRGAQNPPNPLLLGSHQITVEVAVDQGPKFTVRLSIEVTRGTGH